MALIISRILAEIMVEDVEADTEVGETLKLIGMSYRKGGINRIG